MEEETVEGKVKKEPSPPPSPGGEDVTNCPSSHPPQVQKSSDHPSTATAPVPEFHSGEETGYSRRRHDTLGK